MMTKSPSVDKRVSDLFEGPTSSLKRAFDMGMALQPPTHPKTQEGKERILTPKVYTKREILYGSNINTQVLMNDKAFLLQAVFSYNKELASIFKSRKYKILIKKI